MQTLMHEQGAVHEGVRFGHTGHRYVPLAHAAMRNNPASAWWVAAGLHPAPLRVLPRPRPRALQVREGRVPLAVPPPGRRV